MYTYLWPHSQKVYPQKRPPTTHTHTAHTHLLTLTQSIHHSHTHPPTTYTHTVCTTPLTHSPTLTQSTPLTQSHYPYLHSSSSRGRSPVGLFATRSRQSWLSTKTTEDHSIPSLSYSSCSSLKMCLLKYCCSCSLAKLMQNCSKEFFGTLQNQICPVHRLSIPTSGLVRVVISLAQTTTVKSKKVELQRFVQVEKTAGTMTQNKPCTCTS